MRKIAVFVCIVAILLSFFGCKKNYTHGVYEVTIESECISNASVGNEWKRVYKCGSEIVKSGEKWTVPLNINKTVKIDATITERDAWDDVGYGFLNVVLRDGFETSSTITVKENKGRYKGNKALWKVSCDVKLVDKLEKE